MGYNSRTSRAITFGPTKYGSLILRLKNRTGS
jgi:hypothetical protein